MSSARFAAASDRAGQVPRLDGPALVSICGVFFLSRLLFVGVAAVSHAVVLPGTFGVPARSWIERFGHWDAGWYVDIAQQGYHFDPHAASSVAFYPLLPLLMRGLHGLGLDTVLAGYAISHAALFVACLLLWRLAALETRSATVANLAVTFLLLGPGAVWFGLIYTESLFLLVLVGCLFAARRGRWLEAAGWGFAAAVTRTPGLFLAGFLFLEAAQQWWENRATVPPSEVGRPSFARAGVAIAGPVLGQLAFLTFLQVAFGDWHAQQRTMQAGWLPSGPRLPWTALAENWRPTDPVASLLGDPLLAVSVVIGVASFWTLRRWGYPALMLTLTTLYVVSTNGDSLVRYCVTLAPGYIVLAQAARRSRLLETAILGFSVAVFALLTVLLANGYKVN